MPSLSLTIPNDKVQSGIVIEHDPTSPSSSVCPFSPVSNSRHSEDATGDSDFDSDTSPNLKFSFEDWHVPFNTPCQVEVEDETQVLLIPHTSPFFHPPPNPKFNDDTFSADCSLPSVCPTLSSKFDLLHSHSPLSCATFVNQDTPSSTESVMIVDSEPILDDGFPRSIHIVRDVVDKTIPDFPEDARVLSAV